MRPQFEAIAEEFGIEFVAYDVQTVDGLAEYAFYVCRGGETPAVVLVDDNGDGQVVDSADTLARLLQRSDR